MNNYLACKFKLKNLTVLNMLSKTTYPLNTTKNIFKNTYAGLFAGSIETLAFLALLGAALSGMAGFNDFMSMAIAGVGAAVLFVRGPWSVVSSGVAVGG